MTTNLKESILQAIESARVKPEQRTARWVQEKLEIKRGSVWVVLSRLVDAGYLERHEPQGMTPYFTRTAKPYVAQSTPEPQRREFQEALEGISTKGLRSLMADLDQIDQAIFVKRIRATVPLSLEALANQIGLSKQSTQKRQNRIMATLAALKDAEAKSAKADKKTTPKAKAPKAKAKAKPSKAKAAEKTNPKRTSRKTKKETA